MGITPHGETIMTLIWGNVPVPWTVSWTGEERQFVAIDPQIGRRALMQDELPGQGKPVFGKPHAQRQRRCIIECRCDICGKPITVAQSKVSLSHAAWRENAAKGSVTGILQVEPFCHRACARVAIEWCPSLKRDIDRGTLFIRQVKNYRMQIAIIGIEYVPEYVPGYMKRPEDGRGVAGHAKIELITWKDRDQKWLEKNQ